MIDYREEIKSPVAELPPMDELKSKNGFIMCHIAYEYTIPSNGITTFQPMAKPLFGNEASVEELVEAAKMVLGEDFTWKRRDLYFDGDEHPVRTYAVTLPEKKKFDGEICDCQTTYEIKVWLD